MKLLALLESNDETSSWRTSSKLESSNRLVCERPNKEEQGRQTAKSSPAFKSPTAWLQGRLSLLGALTANSWVS